MFRIIVTPIFFLLLSTAVVSKQQKKRAGVPSFRGSQGTKEEWEGREVDRSLQEGSCSSPYFLENRNTGGCLSACRPGFAGYNCTLCQTDGACSLIAPLLFGSDDVEIFSDVSCENGAVYKDIHKIKSYDCSLDESLDLMGDNLKIAAFCDTGEKECSVAVYNKGSYLVTDPFVASCKAKDCTFEENSSTVSCGLINCECSEECTNFGKNVMQVYNDKPVDLVVDEDGFMVLQVPKMLFMLKGQCNKISSCAFAQADISKFEESNTDAMLAQDDIFGKYLTMNTVSGILLIVLIGLSGLITSASLCCSFASNDSNRSKDISKTKTQEDSNKSYSVTSFEWKNVSCRVDTNIKEGGKNNYKNILSSISGKVERGSVLGILGPSGSGKSTLLNALYGTSNGKSIISGQILVDGKQYRSKDLKRISAYVHQDDCLFPTLTVRECIEYSALLRLPKTLSLSEKLDEVDKVINELNLQSVSNNRIGSSFGTSATRHGRVSGGERKRVSIGMELVTSPQILFLDEPTTGLDSYTSRSIMMTLNELASHGRIVILSIHQPNAKVFKMMDQIILLYKGKTMYNNSRVNAVTEFAEYGFACPKTENVADFMLDTISDPESREQFIKAKFSTTEDKMNDASQFHDDEESTNLIISSRDDFKTESFSIFTTPFKEIPVLLQRARRNIARNRSLFVMNVTISLILGVSAGYIFNNVEDNLAGFQNRAGAFYFMLTFFGFSSFSSMDVFIDERRIFSKESGARYYSVSSYFFAKTALDIVSLRVIPILIFGSIFYWFMGLQANINNFVIFITGLLLFNIAAGSISVCISAFCSSVGNANLIATVVFLFMLLFGGFLINMPSLPAFIVWLEYISIFSYGFEILITNELYGLTLSFDAPGYVSIPVNGTVFLESLNMFVENQMKDLLALCIISIVFNMITYVLLKMRVPKA